MTKALDDSQQGDGAIAALRAAYDQYCLEQQLGDWNPRPDDARLVELFTQFHGVGKKVE
jgi:hypothetical protein